jgi:hypothetical protein
MKAIREPLMRRAVAAELLRAGEPSSVVGALRTVLTTAHQQSNPDYRAAAEAITEALTDPEVVDYARRSALYSAARDSGAMEVARLFFEASPGGAADPRDAELLSTERRVVPRGRILTLGERKALARTHRRDLIMHVVRDPHPDVVEVLLDNPHVTERDVVVVSSQRPVPPPTLERVAGHPRWRRRYRIKLALVLNPYTPVHVALRLVTTLRPKDLRSIRDDPSLVAVLREQAGDLLG